MTQFALEKIDVEGVVDEIYDGGVSGGGAVGGSARWRGSAEDGGQRIELLDEPEQQEGDDKERGRRRARHLKRQPLVFWPRISELLLGPFIRGDHPIRAYISRNPVYSFLIAICLLTPPPVIVGVFLLPPLLITDEIVHKVYGTLASAYPSSFEGLEITTRQMVELLRLYILVGKMVIKTMCRIAQRQIKRRGGVTGIAKIAAGRVIDGLQHPVRTAGLFWTFGKDCFSLASDMGVMVRDYAAAAAAAPSRGGFRN